MNYQLLYYFHTLAKNLSFTIAAQKLGIKQPTLSQQIKILEGQVNQQLFYRNNKRVKLSSSGEYLYKQTSAIENILNDTFETLNELNRDENIFRIGVLNGELSDLLSDVCVRFHKKFPLIKIKFLSTDRIQEYIDKRKIDIGFTYNRIPDIHQSKYIGKENFKLISPSNYRLPNNIDIKELINYPMILMTNDYLCRQLVNEEFNKKKIRIMPNLEVSSLEILLKMVKNELGLSIVSETFTNIMDLEDIKISSIDNINLSRKIYMYHSESFNNDSIAQSFFEMTIDELKKLRVAVNDII